MRGLLTGREKTTVFAFRTPEECVYFSETSHRGLPLRGQTDHHGELFHKVRYGLTLWLARILATLAPAERTFGFVIEMLFDLHASRRADY